MARGGKRDGAGRPPGAQNKATSDVREIAQSFTRSAVATLAVIMRDKNQPAAARVSAATAILDRGHGKAKQPVEHELDLSRLTDEQLSVLAVALGAPAVPGQGDGGAGAEEGAD